MNDAIRRLVFGVNLNKSINEYEGDIFFKEESGLPQGILKNLIIYFNSLNNEIANLRDEFDEQERGKFFFVKIENYYVIFHIRPFSYLKEEKRYMIENILLLNKEQFIALKKNLSLILFFLHKLGNEHEIIKSKITINDFKKFQDEQNTRLLNFQNIITPLMKNYDETSFLSYISVFLNGRNSCIYINDFEQGLILISFLFWLFPLSFFENKFLAFVFKDLSNDFFVNSNFSNAFENNAKKTKWIFRLRQDANKNEDNQDKSLEKKGFDILSLEFKDFQNKNKKIKFSEKSEFPEISNIIPYIFVKPITEVKLDIISKFLQANDDGYSKLFYNLFSKFGNEINSINRYFNDFSRIKQEKWYSNKIASMIYANQKDLEHLTNSNFEELRFAFNYPESPMFNTSIIKNTKTIQDLEHLNQKLQRCIKLLKKISNNLLFERFNKDKRAFSDFIDFWICYQKDIQSDQIKDYYTQEIHKKTAGIEISKYKGYQDFFMQYNLNLIDVILFSIREVRLLLPLSSFMKTRLKEKNIEKALENVLQDQDISKFLNIITGELSQVSSSEWPNKDDYFKAISLAVYYLVDNYNNYTIFQDLKQDEDFCTFEKSLYEIFDTSLMQIEIPELIRNPDSLMSPKYQEVEILQRMIQMVKENPLLEDDLTETPEKLDLWNKIRPEIKRILEKINSFLNNSKILENSQAKSYFEDFFYSSIENTDILMMIYNIFFPELIKKH